jgi:methylsterol monooxygenase
MNSTTLGHHASAQELYAAAGTDFSNLSWLESQWAAWYMWIGNPIIATGLMSFIMHEVGPAFFFFSLFFLVGLLTW